ncbi:MAG TPA: zf-HC2 domain-containing protein [Pyrinomonadaceae bacterium]|jgi:anti-sigma factor RsiW|nr:zf-HC2 domain-containing protein [Pyrinomonadaceae bacterium]
MTRVQQKICQKNLIAAYVDGELSEVATAIFEQHIEDCTECRTELRAHRVFVCELDAALTDNVDLPVPKDFSKLIATRARSDMRGVRTAAEHRKAIAICMILALTGFALLSATARDNVFAVVGRFIGGVFSIIGFVGGIVYDGFTGLVVISRVVAHKIVNESGSFAVVLVVLGAGVVLLSRLIHNYHRTGATE